MVFISYRCFPERPWKEMVRFFKAPFLSERTYRGNLDRNHQTIIIMKQIISLFLLFFCTAIYAQQQDSVTIRGRVTDYNGQPIDSVSIWWQDPSFNDIAQAVTDKAGYYSARIPKGKYQSVGAINMATYPHTAKPGLQESDLRLEFWAWDFIADRDTTLDIRVPPHGSIRLAPLPNSRWYAHLSDIRPPHEPDTLPAMAKREGKRGYTR